jgi:glycosyltransferase involved in cell wall biosynthesis
MFHREGDATSRGIFVSDSARALRNVPGVEVDVEIVAQGRSRLDYLAANARVRSRWDEGRHDLVHCHYGLTGLSILTLPTAAPLVATFYGSDINTGWQRAISFATLRRARRRIFVSERLARIWPSPSNLVVPNGVDFEVCRPIDRGSACELLGLDPARRWILFGASPANPVKGHSLFRSALELVQRTHPDADALILSERGQPYERVVQKLNAASCLLFTSRRGTEGSPTVIKEALAVGLPVVSVDVGDASDMLRDISPGAVVPWPDASARDSAFVLAESLAAEVRRVLDAGARSDAREKRSFLRLEAIARRLADIYRDVLRDRERDLRYG